MLQSVREQAAFAVGVLFVIVCNHDHDRYERHWWWDNVAHFTSGFTLGLLLPRGKERQTYAVCALLWEILEWYIASRNYHEIIDAMPNGPRAMGHDEWTLDHQCEDTILDTLMGYYGVRTAMWIKGQ